MNKVKRSILVRSVSAAVSVIVLACSLAGVLPAVFAETSADAVIPLSPLKAGAVGGISAETVSGDGLFDSTYSSVTELVSDTQRNGIIADLDSLVNNISGSNTVVTPLVSGNMVSSSPTVDSQFITTNTLTSEKGVLITPVSGSYEHNGNLGQSTSYMCIKYGRNNSISGADGIMFYLKTEGANLVNLEIDVRDPENSSRWQYSWDPWLMLKKGASYSCMPLGGSSWKTQTAVAREGSDIFGAMQFNSAFEGWVKIPFDSLTNDCGFVLDTRQDSFESIYVRTKGLGGAYGSVTAGPFLVVNNDTGSASITVNNNIPAEAPVTLGTTLGGFKEKLSDTRSVLLYVKTDSANRISLKADIADDCIADMPDLELVPDSTAYLLKKGGTAWEQTEITATETVGAVTLSGAFEGYIKIPLSSFAESDSSVAVLPEIDCVTGFELGVAGLGGKYGRVRAAVWLMNEDTGNTRFKISETYTPPTGEPVQIVPASSAELIMPNWETVTHTVAAPLDFTSAAGSQMTSVDPSGYSVADGRMNESQAFAAFSMSDADVSDYEGLVVYVKLQSANLFMPMIALTMPADTSRWNNSWEPLMMLLAGAEYEYLPAGAAEWRTGTTVAGVAASGYFGAIRFDSAFEGYIKIPFDALKTDSAFEFDTEKDTVSTLYYRLQGIGGEYGTAVIGPSFYIVSDGTEGLELVTDPITVTPLTGGTVNQGNWMTAVHTEKETLSALTSEKGVEITVNTDYISQYEFTGTNLATSQAFASVIYPEKNSLAGTKGLIFYLKTDSSGRVMTELYLNIPEDTSRWQWSWNPVLALKPGAIYSYMPSGGKKWSTATAVQGRDDASAYTGAMYFDAAFEGYVKIPYSSLVHDDGFVFDPAKDTVERVFVRTEGLGGSWGDLTAGPFLAVNSDSDSADIEIYKEPEPPFVPEDDSDKPPAERIANVLKYSKEGLAAGYYFMIGDDSRYELGYPVYRLVSHTLSGEYGMHCSVTAEKGLTAEKWSGSGADSLIEKIPGTGKGSIIDISLGLNDTGKTAGQIAGYINTAADKILAARPDAVIVYTTPNPVMDTAVNTKLAAAAELIAKNSKIYIIDVQSDVFAEYYTQYYLDTDTPNTEGSRSIAKYILSKYLNRNFEKIVTTDAASLTLPKGATLITESIAVGIYVNTAHTVKVMKVGSRFTTGVSLTGTAVSSGIAPFSSNNQTRLTLSHDITGSSYVAFRLVLPAANRIGVSGFREDGNEVIFMKGQKYEILPDGQSEWTERVSGPGRDDDLKTYGSLDFDGAFSGWVRLPMRGFYNTPSAENKVNNFRFMFSELGGNYGTVDIGPFISMTETPYTAQGVWSSSVLPEMVPFTDVVGLNKYWEVMTEFVPSPIPTLSDNKSLWIGCDPAIDKTGVDYMQSWYWAELQYDDMPVGEFSHLMFYVKVPDTKENRLSICIFDDTDFEYKVMAKSLYALLPLGEEQWQHYYAEDVGLHNYGGIILPAGFEGFIKLPVSSLMPSNVPDDAKFSRISYRFSYIGSGDERVLVGPTFGVTKDNDPGPAEVVYTSLPEPTTIKKIYAIEDGDIFADKVMVYWQPLDDAKSYIIEAYLMTKIEKGFEYRLVSSKTAFTNSGTIGGLEMGTQYAILVKACDSNGNVIAIYEFTRVKTLTENPYTFATFSDELTYDAVYYPAESGTSGGLAVMIAVISGAAVLLGGAAVLIIILVKRKRRKTDE